MKRPPRSGRRIASRGAQAVEFALVLPFLLLIIFAVIDFFFLAHNKAVITNASREAARRATLLTTATWNTNDIRAVACNYARGALISVGAPAITTTCNATGDPTISVTPTAAPSFNDPVTVTVSYTVQGFSLGSWWNLGTGPNSVGAPMVLTATTTMNHE